MHRCPRFILTTEHQTRYFRKFVKVRKTALHVMRASPEPRIIQAWNRGKLPEHLYSGVAAPSASSQTGYRWSFASKASNAESAALQAARDEVGAATHNLAASSAGSGRLKGPTLPSAADLTLAREAAAEHRSAERDYQRKRGRKEGKEQLEDMIGPKPVGREGMLEKKRAQREGDRTFRERGDEGLEVDESTLMGGGSSFKDECVSLLLLPCAGVVLRAAARSRFPAGQAGQARRRAAEIRGEAAWPAGRPGGRGARTGGRATAERQGDDGYVHADGEGKIRMRMVSYSRRAVYGLSRASYAVDLLNLSSMQMTASVRAKSIYLLSLGTKDSTLLSSESVM